MREITDAELAEFIQQMKRDYGRQYLAQWPDFSDSEVFAAFKTGLAGVSQAEFNHGREMLKRDAWPPNVPAFRNMCEQGGTWLTQNEAWATALAYASNPAHPISKQAKRAFDAVSLILGQEGQRAASATFKDIYARIVADCRANNIPQEQHIEPLRIETERVGKLKGSPMPNDFSKKIHEAFRSTKS